jgi:outer membrane protein assembly factor BamB
MPTEGVMLWVALFTCVVFAAARPGQADIAGGGHTGGGRALTIHLDKKTWMKVFDDNGAILSSPLVADGRVYLTAACGAFNRYGSVYCVDLQTRNLLWTFTGWDKEAERRTMKEGFSNPVFADGRIYFGEGFHQDSNCKLYCLDAKTGNKLWEFQTGSHTESTPVVVGGRVYFGAGDDGVYCVDAVKGTKIWQFPVGDRAKTLHLHVDSTPAVAGKRVYVGGGIDEETGAGDGAIACLDADTGKELWVHPTPKWMVKRGETELRPLPAWGSPVVDGKQVFFGLGNGRITEDSKTFEPVGALLCIADDGKKFRKLWSFKVGNGVLNRPAVDRTRVYFGSRDKHVYCLDRQTGKERWKQELLSAAVASPVLEHCSTCGHAGNVYALGIEGQVYCLDAYTGTIQWGYTEPAKNGAKLAGAPAVVLTHTPEGDRRRLYLGAALNGMTIPVLYCLEDLSPEP